MSPPTRKRRRHVAPAAPPPPPVSEGLVSADKTDRTTMANNSRIQVPATEAQKALLKDAADKAGYANVRATGGMGAYIANRVLVVAAAELAGVAPLALAPKISDDIRALAAAEGCTEDELMVKALDMFRAVRVSAHR